MKKVFSKLLVLFLTLCLGVGFISCNNKVDDPNKDKEQEPQEQKEPVVNEEINLTLDVNQSQMIVITYSGELLCSFSEEGIASFNNGVFTGLKAGTTKATLTCTGNADFKKIYNITVNGEYELSVTIPETIYIGDSFYFDVKELTTDTKIIDFSFFGNIDTTSSISYYVLLEDGKFVARQAGVITGKIIATFEGIQLVKDITITILNKPIENESTLVSSLPDSLYPHQTVGFTLTLMPENVEITNFTMTSSNEDIMECYPEDLEIVTYDSGAVTITYSATYNGVTYELTKTYNVLEEISLSTDLLNEYTTEKNIPFVVKVMPDNVEITDYSCSSNNTNVFTVENGLIKPVAPGKGKLIISTTYNGASVSLTIDLTITEFIPDSISCNLIDYMIVGDTKEIKTEILPSKTAITTLKYEVENTSVAEVIDGVITAKAVGSTKLTITCNELTKVIDLDVISVEGISVEGPSELLENEIAKYYVYAEPSKKVLNQGNLVIEGLGDNNNVLLDQYYVFGQTIGTTNITFKFVNGDDTYSVTKDISVKKLEYPIERLTISASTGMFVGNFSLIEVNKFPANGVGNYIIESLDPEIIKYEQGVNILTALKEGKCKVRAYVENNPSVSAEIEITVFPTKEVEVVSDGVYNGEPVTARYYEDSIINYYELMCGVTETTYFSYTSTTMAGDIDGYTGLSGEIEPNKYYEQETHVLEVPSTTAIKIIPWANINTNTWKLTTVKGLIENYEKANPGYKVIAAVNGDFFDINANKNLPYSTTGENISDGEFYKAISEFPWTGGTLGFTNDGSNLTLIGKYPAQVTDYFILDVYDDNGNIVKTFNVNKYNTEPSDGETSVYYGTYNSEQNYVPIQTLSEGTFVIGEAYRALPSSDSDFYGKGVITSTGAATLQVGQFAITSKDPEVLAYLQVGMNIRVQREFVGEFASVTSATGYNGLVFNEDGIFDFYANGNLANRAPRTVIGMKEDGTIVMMVVDGRQGGSGMHGCDGYELTAIMRAYGCVKAYNLDGGGSSTIVVRTEEGLKVLNSPSDGRERSDGNCILICTVDPEYKAENYDVTTNSAKVKVTTDVSEYQNYPIYLSLENEFYELVNGEIEFTNLVHNNNYSYRVYYKVGETLYPTQTVGTITTSKANFKLLGIVVKETDDAFIVTAYADDNDKCSNIKEMNLIVNGKSIYLKDFTITLDKKTYGDTIESIKASYWYYQGTQRVDVENSSVNWMCLK